MKIDEEFFEIIYSNLKLDLETKIKQTISVIERKLENEPIETYERALCLFFVYEKDLALAKFKNFLAKRNFNNRTKNFEINSFIEIEIFFKKLNLDYIPYFNLYSKSDSEMFSTIENSVNYSELRNFIDSGNYFNKKTPLANYPIEKLVNPIKDIPDFQRIKNILYSLFEVEYKVEINFEFEGNEINVIDVFLSNISDPYPEFEPHILIFAREQLKVALNTEFNLKYFLGTFYLLREHELFNNLTVNFPTIISSYLGSDILKHSMAKTYFNKNSGKQEKRYEKDLDELEERFFV